jgi:cytidine deaminase
MAARHSKNAMADELVAAAEAVREHAYAPYSHFKVGAALRGASGQIFIGCNVENASFGLTLCAERLAVAAAVAAGEREFAAIAVVAGGRVVVPPCGMCRQALAEFAGSELPIILSTPGKSRAKRKTTTLGQLMPLRFDHRHL